MVKNPMTNGLAGPVPRCPEELGSSGGHVRVMCLLTHCPLGPDQRRSPCHLTIPRAHVPASFVILD